MLPCLYVRYVKCLQLFNRLFVKRDIERGDSLFDVADVLNKFFLSSMPTSSKSITQATHILSYAYSARQKNVPALDTNSFYQTNWIRNFFPNAVANFFKVAMEGLALLFSNLLMSGWVIPVKVFN